MRRFLWSHTRVGGTPLEYTGTGVELFVGFLVVFVGLLLPIGVLFRLDEILGLDVVTQGLINLLLFAIIGFLSGIAIFRARRYRLSRTRWRGIRGSMTGSSVAFGWFYFWSIPSIGVAFGWLYPWRNVRLWERLVDHTQIGDKTMSFGGSTAGLYGRFVVLWLVAIAVVGQFQWTVTQLSGIESGATSTQAAGEGVLWLLLLLLIGLPIYAWYKAKEIRHLVKDTRFLGVRFTFEPSAGQLLRLVIPNTLLTVLSIGLLSPIAQWRYMRFVCRHLRNLDPINWYLIAQSSAAAPTSGEGLADAFDAGGAF